MSAGNNILWAAVGAFAGYALAVKLFEDDQAESSDDGEGSEVDDEADPEIDVPVMRVQEWDGEQWVN
jgi:hypothetical protein